ncbi:protein kinase domain-containing protein [Desulfocurvus sp. DL9XJH121]
MSKIALTIGINSYIGSELKCCVDDAVDVATMLREDNFGYIVYELRDLEATLENIKSEISRILKGNHEDIVIFFAGHGVLADDGVYLCSVDCKRYNEGLSVAYLNRIINSIAKDKNVLLILDCCHSGAAMAKNRSVVPITNAIIEEEFSGIKNRSVLAACDISEKAKERHDLGHGIFTYCVLLGLSGYAADMNGDITVTSLYDFLVNEMNKFSVPSPVLKSDITDKHIIGSGFDALTVELLVGDAKEIVLKKFKSIYSNCEDVFTKNFFNQDWKKKGYKDSCVSVSAVVRWCEKKLEKHPDLKRDKEFLELYQSLNNRVSHLSRLDPGTVTKWGNVAHMVGNGAFGSVYKINGDDDKMYAYKVYHPHDLANSEKRKRFARGYEAMKQMDHPHIVKVWDFSECPFGFLMDYIDGPNLRDFGGAFETLDETISLLLTIADTLQHAHVRSVIHRDVKPENIILRYENNVYRPYLTDFDLAWHSTATQITQEALGTLFYASPEQLQTPKAPISHAITTDIYSFGQLCFYAITMSDPAPSRQKSNIEALNVRLNSWPSYEAARDFVDLYTGCTMEIPRDRIQNFSDVSNKLLRIKNKLKHIDMEVDLEFADFLDEVVFASVGLAPEKRQGEGVFESHSGMFLISISSKSKANDTFNIEISILAKGDLPIQGATAEKARSILNRRVDQALKGYKRVKRTNGRSHVYEIILNYSTKINMDGVEVVKSIISSAINSLEARC